VGLKNEEVTGVACEKSRFHIKAVYVQKKELEEAFD